MTQNVDLFDGIETADSAPVETEPETPTDDTATTTDTEATEDDKPVETVATVPSGAVSVTDFAAYMTQVLMREAFESGGEFDPSQYVVPQAVYQTVKAQRDRIPHVLVKGPDDSEGRVYILRDEATVWWKNRKERLATRGQGSVRASARTPEDNLSLLAEAVKKNLYAVDRNAMWIARIEQTTKLVDKYKGFLSEANIAEDTVALAVQEATDQYNQEKAAKEAEKAAKAKKSKSETTDEDNE